MAVTKGSVALSKALLHNRPLRRRLVGACDVSEQTIRNWESGACEPRDRQKETLEKEIGIERGLWKEAPAAEDATGPAAA